ncbi:MAG: hypothetical protein K9I92_04810 [Chitinophagaceae bacterium]|jgi:hypothetical protein|nr:hypothetical protein [Chitinophagaceae bacterium]
MNNQFKPLDEIREIRSIMERSSRFQALSGIAGVVVGFIAIAGTVIAYAALGLSYDQVPYEVPGQDQYSAMQMNGTFLLFDALVVLILSAATGIFFAVRNAKKKGLPVWDNAAKRLLINFAIPLAAGGAFCAILFYHGHFALMAPATLIFYGMALLNGSKYSIDDIRYLGIIEIVIGLLAAVFIGHGLIFWALGFGLVHIIYGIRFYIKYEK